MKTCDETKEQQKLRDVKPGTVFKFRNRPVIEEYKLKSDYGFVGTQSGLFEHQVDFLHWPVVVFPNACLCPGDPE